MDLYRAFFIENHYSTEKKLDVDAIIADDDHP